MRELIEGTRSHFHQRLRCQRPAAAAVWADTSAACLHDRGGQPRFLLLQFIEVSLEVARPGAQLATAGRDERNFQSFFDVVDDIIVVARQDGRILYGNRALHERLGYDEHELKALHVLNLNPSDKQKEAQEIFAGMLRGERGFCPLPLQTKSGDLVPAETRIWRGTWNDEECIFGVSKDLTREQEALQKFDRLFDVSPTLMAVSDAQTHRFTDVNKAFLKVLGYARDEVIGHRSAELDLFVHPEEQERVAEQLRDQGRVLETALQVRAKDGRVLDGLFSGELLESQGKLYFLTEMIDETARKRAQLALRESEERYRFLADNIADILWVLDLESLRLTYASASIKRLLGITVEEALTRTLDELLTPESMTQARTAIAQAVAALSRGESPDVQVMELDQYRKDGSILATEVTGRVLPPDAGQPIQMLGVTRDITERRLVQEALRASEHHLHSILDTASAVIAVYDLGSGRLSSVNEAMERVLGFTLEEANQMEQRLGALLLSHDLACRERIQELLASPPGATVEWEALSVSARGERVWLRQRATVFDREPDGRPVSILVTATDVTEQHVAQAELARTAEYLRATLDSLLEPHMRLAAVRDERGAIADFEVVDANPAAVALTSLSLDELLGTRVLERFPQFVSTDAMRNQVKVVETGTPLVLDDVSSVFHEPGLNRRLDIRAVRLGDGVSLTLRDATSRHEAESVLRQRLAELDALQQMSALLVQRIDLATALESVCTLLAGLFSACSVKVRLLPAEGRGAGAEFCAGEEAPGFKDGAAEAGAIARALTDGSAARTSGPDDSQLLAVPLRTHSETFGVLSIMRLPGAKAFSSREEALALTVADLLAGVIRSEHLHEVETYQATAHERQRLARDLHDAVTQSIYSANLLAEVLPSVLKDHPDEALKDAIRIRQLIRAAFAELRILLFELRPESLAAAPLPMLLERLADALAGQSTLAAELHIDQAINLPADVRLAFYRIAQEALNNIGKHAYATKAAISVTGDSSAVRLMIHDNGRGFSPSEARPTLGMTSMRERAAGIGATLEVVSSPGAGTVVILEWPVPPLAP
jgi:PAS domain S-box-containing protein